MGEKGLPASHPETGGFQQNRQQRPDSGPGVFPGGCGLLRLNTRVGGGQTPQLWVSPDTVPPSRLVGASPELQRAHAGGRSRATGLLAPRDPLRVRSGLVAQHSAVPSLVRKSYKLAVEERKVGNQTGSFLERRLSFFYHGFSHHHRHHRCFLFYYGFGFIFPPPFSANPSLPAHSLVGFSTPA